MNKKKLQLIDNDHRRYRLSKIYNRLDIISSLGFFILYFFLPQRKLDNKSILLILINDPKKGLIHIAVIVICTIGIYIVLRIYTNKTLPSQNKSLPKERSTFGIFNRNDAKKEAKIITKHNIWYSVDVTTTLEQEDLDFSRPIITIKYLSTLNPSVKKIAIFSKNTSLGNLTLSESYEELDNIINECIASSIPFELSYQSELTLTNEEAELVQRIKDKIAYCKLI